jgi:alpha-beta hydrolase superfamily lysophospholipase
MRQRVGKCAVALGVATLAALYSSSGVLGQEADSLIVREVSFVTDDGITVYGDLCLGDESKATPIILLFHQGGGNARAEYGPLVPRLIEQGFNALAIDQRRGGEQPGGINRTVAALEGAEHSYCDAYADLEAALRYVMTEGYSGVRIAWGSSYSATLAIRLAAEHPGEVHGVLAFSPACGAEMQECRRDADSAVLSVPLLILQSASEMQEEEVQRQLAMFQEQGHATYIADPGVHGSSMLNAERVGASVERNWEVVLAFLRAIVNR